MNMRLAATTLLCLVVFCPRLHALESDQFTLPKQPLVDSGPLLSRRVFYLLQYIVRQGNNEFRKLSDSERLDERFPAKQVFQVLGRGIPESSVERWLRIESFPQRPMRYNIPFWDSIFMGVFSPLPLAFVQLAPTINQFGILMGTDKAGHFFQQGHGYYILQMDGERAGKLPDQTRAEAVAIGVEQERGRFGTELDGVFSNADLAANYAGMKFYESLTRAVGVGARTVGPMLVLQNGRWELSPDADPDRLLEPFITEHLNEALNPSQYAFNRERVRGAIVKRCPDWRRQYPRLTREILAAKTQELRNWYGENYGHWLPPENAITLADSCF
jgi:hypothetical protein